MWRTHLLCALAPATSVCWLLSLSSAQAAPILAVDFGDRAEAGPGNPVEPGFSVFTITNANTMTNVGYGGYNVIVSDTGTPILDDRKRSGPANSGAFTQSALMSDFVFADEANTAGQGLDVRIQGLTPNANYDVTVWSYDAALSSVDPNRISDWFANGTQVVNDHNMSGPAPTTNAQYSFSFTHSADGSGELLLAGRNVTTSGAVAINGFTISESAVPEPAAIGLLAVGSIAMLRRHRRR